MTDVKDLVSIDDGVIADPTMREWKQLIRIDLVKKPPIKAQVLYSRILLADPKKRDNVGYISYSNPGDLFTLARYFFAAGIALMLQKSMPFFRTGIVDVPFAVRDTLLKQISDENGIIDLTRRYMKGLK